MKKIFLFIFFNGDVMGSFLLQAQVKIQDGFKHSALFINRLSMNVRYWIIFARFIN